MLAPLSNYWEGPAPPPPSSYSFVSQKQLNNKKAEGKVSPDVALHFYKFKPFNRNKVEFIPRL